jgi:hypothetical protein
MIQGRSKPSYRVRRSNCRPASADFSQTVSFLAHLRLLYCHDGFRSTLAWLQLKALGYQDVRVYNGGCADWDRTLTLPIVKGNKPFDADFEL